ncbi:MAG: tRNA (N(6)-L-threonylcarbamoyladenosine(37)-C(2))-methylthiotransferase MtaB [Treponema sp.]|nr:tRNA (N(6)-L-threonylcarbamoyladenosine(37)-C(2))-methylthiotransferase MtaB [Treponema sp.]
MALDKTVHFETLGCRLNQIETEGAAEFFSDSGWLVQMKSVAAKDAEDKSTCLCVLNTCAVTGKAEQKARRTINLLLKKFPAAALIVTGCYAELSQSQIAAMDERIAVLPGKAKSALAGVPSFLQRLGTKGAAQTAAALREHFANPKSAAPREQNASQAQEAPQTKLFGRPKSAAPQFAIEPFALNPKTFFAHSRAAIKIQDGCDNNCSYCAIHFARGKSVSIDAALALERVAALEAAGQSEVVLTGVNIGQYHGLWKGQPIDIAGFLELILTQTKRIAIRFSSIYPQTVTERFCDVIKDPRVRPHFHLSVQSGSDAVLARMNRPYKRGAVLQACRRLKEAKQNPFLACDIITGFPGETEQDFEQTLLLLKEAGFVNAHAFPFSPRPGTAAANFTPKIPERVKDQRVAALNEYSAAAKIAYINSFAGTVRQAVAESAHGRLAVPAGKTLVRAVTDNFIHAEILLDANSSAAQNAPAPGSPILVKILGANEAAIRAGQEWEAAAQLC